MTDAQQQGRDDRPVGYARGAGMRFFVARPYVDALPKGVEGLTLVGTLSRYLEFARDGTVALTQAEIAARLGVSVSYVKTAERRLLRARVLERDASSSRRHRVLRLRDPRAGAAPAAPSFPGRAATDEASQQVDASPLDRGGCLAEAAEWAREKPRIESRERVLQQQQRSQHSGPQNARVDRAAAERLYEREIVPHGVWKDRRGEMVELLALLLGEASQQLDAAKAEEFLAVKLRHVWDEAARVSTAATPRPLFVEMILGDKPTDLGPSVRRTLRDAGGGTHG